MTQFNNLAGVPPDYEVVASPPLQEDLPPRPPIDPNDEHDTTNREDPTGDRKTDLDLLIQNAARTALLASLPLFVAKECALELLTSSPQPFVRDPTAVLLNEMAKRSTQATQTCATRIRWVEENVSAKSHDRMLARLFEHVDIATQKVHAWSGTRRVTHGRLRSWIALLFFFWVFLPLVLKVFNILFYHTIGIRIPLWQVLLLLWVLRRRRPSGERA